MPLDAHGLVEGQHLGPWVLHTLQSCGLLVLSPPIVLLLGNMATINTEMIIYSPGNYGHFKNILEDSKINQLFNWFGLQK